MVDKLCLQRDCERGSWDVDSKRNDFESPGEDEGLNAGHPQENSQV